MTTRAPEPDPLGPLKRRLARFVLVTLTAVAATMAIAACAIAIFGQLGAGESPLGWVSVAGAGMAGARLLVFVYRRLR